MYICLYLSKYLSIRTIIRELNNTTMTTVPFSQNHEAELKKLTDAGKYPITEPLSVTLNDSNQTRATLFPVNRTDEISKSLMNYLWQNFNREIEDGQTYPYFDTFDLDHFKNYWFSHFVAILVLGDYGNDKSVLLNEKITHDEWDKLFLGTYYIKPNYPGRVSNVCNAGFVVSKKFRNTSYKIGRNLGKTYLKWAPRFGYTYSVFNLVFETNIGSLKIWDSLGFERIGFVKNVARLRGHDGQVGAVIFGKDLVLED